MNSLMQFDGVAAVLALIALIAIFVGFKLLSSSSWIIGWLRGNVGMLFVLITGIIALCITDVRSYRPMFDDKPIATVSFDQTSPQNYQMRIVDVMGIETRYPIAGDEWRISIKQLKWSTRFSGMGLGHGYRITGIIGQYIGGQKPPQENIISASSHVDVWEWIHNHFQDNFFVSANLVITEPVMLVDGSMYEVVPSGSEISVYPLNEIAKKAEASNIELGGGATSGTVTVKTIVTPEAEVTSVPTQPVSPPAAGSSATPAQ